MPDPSLAFSQTSSAMGIASHTFANTNPLSQGNMHIRGDSAGNKTNHFTPDKTITPTAGHVAYYLDLRRSVD
jgi:hypothetical protein